ncbi:Uncharacterised protein [Mycobacteroides abscessus subsp. massiliense]|nr:Uncharacterised protein [Mycobacteroides abscessus subsp. massiliense]
MSRSIPELPLERFFTGRQKVISKLINGLIFKKQSAADRTEDVF